MYLCSYMSYVLSRLSYFLCLCVVSCFFFFFFFQAEDGIRDHCVTGIQTCALPICAWIAAQVAGAGATGGSAAASAASARSRSEERRVGKECRARWSPDHEKKKKKTRSGRV